MMKILIVDDNPEVRNTLTEYLGNQSDFEVIGAADNGETGFRMICEKKPDIAILDIVMPKLDGLCLLKRLQNMPNLKTSYIMYSAIGNDKVIERAFSLGAQYFITKPCNDLSIIAERLRQVNALLDKVQGEKAT